MAKGIYVGVNGTAQKINKAYVGVNNIARTIRRAYVGVAGKARLVYSLDSAPGYHSSTTISKARAMLAGASTSSYALFAGGGAGVSRYDIVDSFNKSGSKSTGTALSEARTALAATSIDGYAVFAGGIKENGYPSGTVDAYRTSLTKLSNVRPLYVASAELAAATIGDHAIFAGGDTLTASSGDSGTSSATPYDKSLTRGDELTLYSEVTGLAGASNSAYAVFGGGYGQTTSSSSNNWRGIVTGINAELTRHKGDSITSRSNLAAATCLDYVLLAGGTGTSGKKYNIVNTVDTSLTVSTQAETLTISRCNMAAVTCGDYAIFAGGNADNNVVECYGPGLTHEVLEPLSKGREDGAAACAGRYIFIAGGTAGSFPSNVVDVYIQ